MCWEILLNEVDSFSWLQAVSLDQFHHWMTSFQSLLHCKLQTCINASNLHRPKVIRKTHQRTRLMTFKYKWNKKLTQLHRIRCCTSSTKETSKQATLAVAFAAGKDCKIWQLKLVTGTGYVLCLGLRRFGWEESKDATCKHPTNSQGSHRDIREINDEHRRT